MLFRSLVLGIAVAWLATGAVHAQWTSAQRGAFMNDCVPGCESNPNVHPSRRSECRRFCECFVQESERQFSDYAALERELGGQIESENARRFKAIGPLCNQRVFGQ